MPDDMRHHAVIDDPIIDRRRDAMDALRDARAALAYAENGERHGNALHYLGRAAEHLEAAAGHAPEYRGALLPLATHLLGLCDCAGHPYLGDVPGIEAAARAVLAALKTHGEVV